MEESLRIRVFDRIPSAEEFASEIEPRNVPAVFTGCVKNWRAFAKWDVTNGGLEYMQELAGSSYVAAMVSRSAPAFYGDMRSHERVALPFATFIGYCKALMQQKYGSSKCTPESSPLEEDDYSDKKSASPQQIYLAQVSIHTPDKKDRTQLECLREDIEMPAFLVSKELDSINLWMNSARTRTSTHYDPYHNLLCILSGYKRVCFWPPSAAPSLYLHPLYGESSNHSAIPLENCDLSRYPRAKSLDEISLKVNVSAGDAVFIPEGWFHQVDSGDLTIAVNFWWQSDMMSGMLEHMDSYYLRRVLKRLTDKETDRLLAMPPTSADGRKQTNSCQDCSTPSTENFDRDSNETVNEKVNLEDRYSSHQLEPNTLKSLHQIVSFVHDRVYLRQPVDKISPDSVGSEKVKYADEGAIQSIFNLDDEPTANILWNLDPHDRINLSQLVDNISADSVVSEEENYADEVAIRSIFNLEDDPIANILWNLDPHACKMVILAMAHNFPRTLEAFILHALSPVGAEVLTRKFEQMDQIMTAEEGGQFYMKFYDVFDDESSAGDALLNGKETFASLVFNNVLARYLGVDVNGSKATGSSTNL